MSVTRKIFLAGHRGMVGSALLRRLHNRSDIELITASRDQLDLLNQQEVFDFLEAKQPDVVIVAAAKVGGILANNQLRADFLYQNLQIECNLVHGAHLAQVPRLLMLGSSCIYPKQAPQPLTEDSLLTGPLEVTNEPYAIAKIAGIKLCEAYAQQYGRRYFSVMPTNLYGPNDNYDLLSSHVLPALIRKAHCAKAAGESEMPVWGTGTPRREFLYVDDLAEACVHLLDIDYQGPMLNVGVGQDISIGEVAQLVADVIGYKGHLTFDHTKPDGTQRKLLDISRIAKLGWKPRTPLKEGIELAYSQAPIADWNHP